MHTGVWVTQTHTPFCPYRFMCFATHKHTIELQRCTYFFSSVRIHTYLPLYLEVILLPPLALYPHTCPPMPLSHCFLPRHPELCVPCKYLQTCLTDTTLPSPLRSTQILPCIQTLTSAHAPVPHAQYHTISLYSLNLPQLTISNFHERHVSFRLVLKGNVFVDSHASRPLGSQNHL